MAINSEGIYSTRPWKIYGEGPSTQVTAGPGMKEGKLPELTSAYVHFTTKGDLLYIFVQDWPARKLNISSLALREFRLPPGLL
jgi:alpha-L-fucosidase